ncbi:LptF/LptG family permease [Myxococcota bacterium]|nr:LptF/LptG family permease [Myxococcota bacterium]
MRLIRYFAMVFAAILALTLLVLVILVVAANLVEAGNFTKKNVGWSPALILAALNGLKFGHQLLPISGFLAALAAGTLLARRGELLAAGALGIGPVRVWGAFFIVAVITSSLGTACGEYVVPRAVSKAQYIKTHVLRRRDPLQRYFSRRIRWYKDGAWMLSLPGYDAEAQQFIDPVAYKIEDGLISNVYQAERLVQRSDKSSGKYSFFLEGVTQISAKEAETHKLKEFELFLSVSLSDLVDLTGDPRQMSRSELSALIERRERAKLDAAAHRLELHERLAMPWSLVWLLLLVAPWAFHPSTRRSLAVNLGAGVGVVALLIASMQVFRLLALAHRFPPALGAWGGAITALILMPFSYWGYHRYRTRGSVF